MPGHIENRTKTPDKTNRNWTLVVDNGRKIDTKGKSKRSRIKKAFHGTYKQAEIKLARLVTLVDTGLYFDAENLTVETFFKKWLEEYAKPRTADKTYLCYEQICNNFIIPRIGPLKLDKLKPLHLEKYYNDLRTSGRLDKKEGGLAASSLIKHHRIIHKALDTAVKWQLLALNAADAVEPPKIDRSQKSETNAFEPEQVLKMLEAAVGTPHYREILIAVYTGMRRGEIYGLRWQDIDWENQQIRVRQTIQYTPERGTFFKAPKTHKGIRNIDITDVEISVLKDQKKAQAEFKLALDPDVNPPYNDHDLVFCQEYGDPTHPDTISSWFPKFVVNAGLPRIRFHDLRHTNITNMIKSGTPIVVAAARAGHAQPSTTSNIYSHALPSMQKDAANKIKDMFSGTK